MPSFDVSQPLPTSKEDRLRTIIKNLEEHHAQVRYRAVNCKPLLPAIVSMCMAESLADMDLRLEGTLLL